MLPRWAGTVTDVVVKFLWPLALSACSVRTLALANLGAPCPWCLASDPCGALRAIALTFDVIEELWAGFLSNFILNYGVDFEREIEHQIIIIVINVRRSRHTVYKAHEPVRISSARVSKLRGEVVVPTGSRDHAIADHSRVSLENDSASFVPVCKLNLLPASAAIAFDREPGFSAMFGAFVVKQKVAVVLVASLEHAPPLARARVRHEFEQSGKASVSVGRARPVPHSVREIIHFIRSDLYKLSGVVLERDVFLVDILVVVVVTIHLLREHAWVAKMLL